MFSRSTTSLLLFYGMMITACQPSDESLRTEINDHLSMIPGVSVSVKKGHVILHGTVKDEVAKSAVEEAVREIKGVKSVTDSLTIYRPMIEELPAPVIVINADHILKQTLDSVYQAGGITTIDVFVNDGAVTLEGIATPKDIKKVIRITRQYSSGNISNNIKPLKK